ncbi:hypothetical protein DRW07_03570 [Alteromonas sediminis]|uniref:TVP38/TMEM64 family membrane protein n=1 Tax=Alteromonas sediminis TaxID=2259342 RepID=A0A3N5Y5Q0_9ALTE|nr:hypothetical protein [Alteromonas sediminis]RPJ68496.1 hypothetical protein DRW07_03570 [Alteromonas sediminis]
MSESQRHSQVSLKIGLALLLLGIAVFLYYTDISVLVTEIKAFALNPQADPVWFILALCFLPLLGLPLSIFCIVAGAKFGVGWGLVIIGIAMMCQMVACYLAMHSFIKPSIIRWLDKKDRSVPDMGRSSQIKWAVGIVALPILPYMMKNLLLASGSLSLAYYLLINWSIQLLHAVPYVMFSGAMKDQNFTLVAVAVVLILALSGGAHYANKKRQ